MIARRRLLDTLSCINIIAAREEHRAIFFFQSVMVYIFTQKPIYPHNTRLSMQLSSRTKLTRRLPPPYLAAGVPNCCVFLFIYLLSSQMI